MSFIKFKVILLLYWYFWCTLLHQILFYLLYITWIDFFFFIKCCSNEVLHPNWSTLNSSCYLHFFRFHIVLCAVVLEADWLSLVELLLPASALTVTFNSLTSQRSVTSAFKETLEFSHLSLNGFTEPCTPLLLPSLSGDEADQLVYCHSCLRLELLLSAGDFHWDSGQ